MYVNRHQYAITSIWGRFIKVYYLACREKYNPLFEAGTFNFTIYNAFHMLKIIGMKNPFFISLAFGIAFSACINKNSNLGNELAELGHLASMVVSDPSGNFSGESSASEGSLISVANMQNPRAAHTAALLKDGTVLICGGFTGNSSNSLSSAELFNPSQKSFTKINPLTTPRFNQSATLLPNGKVLIAGGYNNNALSTTEIYDPRYQIYIPHLYPYSFQRSIPSNSGSLPLLFRQYS